MFNLRLIDILCSKQRKGELALVKRNSQGKIDQNSYNEESLVKAIIDGHIEFRRRYVNSYAKRGWVSKCRVFKLYTENGGCGAFPYFTVCGVDIENANHIRLYTAIEEKKDIGVNSRYTWL